MSMSLHWVAQSVAVMPRFAQSLRRCWPHAAQPDSFRASVSFMASPAALTPKDTASQVNVRLVELVVSVRSVAVQSARSGVAGLVNGCVRSTPPVVCPSPFAFGQHCAQAVAVLRPGLKACVDVVLKLPLIVLRVGFVFGLS